MVVSRISGFLETPSVTTQQILPLIGLAIGVNVVLIAIALLSLRANRRRGGPADGPDLQATHALMLARAAAGVDGPGPARDSLVEAPEATYRFSAEAPSNGIYHDHEEGPAEAAPAAGSGGPSAEADLHTDTATGLESPQAWRRAVDDEVARLARYHRPATVVIIEIDGFERFSDRLGPVASDRVVVATAKTLRAHARAADRCARFGRGRFAVLLPETDEVATINFVERVRSECDRWLEAGEVSLRLAIGWVKLDAAEGAATAIQEAERRLDAERRQRAGAPA